MSIELRLERDGGELADSVRFSRLHNDERIVLRRSCPTVRSRIYERGERRDRHAERLRSIWREWISRCSA
jgi:hypothetical protein